MGIMTISSAIEELKKRFSDIVFTGESELLLHGQNETGIPVTPPDAVLYPKDTRTSFTNSKNL